MLGWRVFATRSKGDERTIRRLGDVYSATYLAAWSVAEKYLEQCEDGEALYVDNEPLPATSWQHVLNPSV